MLQNDGIYNMIYVNIKNTQQASKIVYDISSSHSVSACICFKDFLDTVRVFLSFTSTCHVFSSCIIFDERNMNYV